MVGRSASQPPFALRNPAPPLGRRRPLLPLAARIAEARDWLATVPRPASGDSVATGLDDGACLLLAAILRQPSQAAATLASLNLEPAARRACIAAVLSAIAPEAGRVGGLGTAPKRLAGEFALGLIPTERQPLVSNMRAANPAFDELVRSWRTRVDGLRQTEPTTANFRSWPTLRSWRLGLATAASALLLIASGGSVPVGPGAAGAAWCCAEPLHVAAAASPTALQLARLPARLALAEIPVRQALEGVVLASVPAESTVAATNGFKPSPAATLFIHYNPHVAGAAARAEAIAGFSERSGVAVGRLIPVDVTIRRDRLRYFHRETAREATRLGRALDDLVAPEIQDFTTYRPQPSRPTLELWLAGDPHGLG